MRVKLLPELKAAVQVVLPPPQLIPAGALVTDPPVAGAVTATLNCGVGCGPKFATTAWFDAIVTVQPPVPLQAPPQPVNAEPEAGFAARLTTVLAEKPEEQVVPQIIPAGTLVTVPEPVPAWLTDNVYCGAKRAITAVSAVNATVHVPSPAQAAPLQPAKADPGPGVAESTTEVPTLREAEHVLPQLMPAGELVTVPEPVPPSVTVSVACGGGAAPKLATTLISEFSVTLHPPVPEHDPPQPVKTNPVLGATVKATAEPPTKLVLQAVPQLIPPGLLTIDPPLDGAAETESEWDCGVLEVVVFDGMPALLFPVSLRAGPVPPQATNERIKSATLAAHSTDRRPPTRITSSSCRGTEVPLES